MLYVGIDLGTSAVKLLLMDGEGNIKNIVSKEYPLWYHCTNQGVFAHRTLVHIFPSKEKSTTSEEVVLIALS